MFKFIRNLITCAVVLALGACMALVYLGYKAYTAVLEASPLETLVAEIRAEENYTAKTELPQIYLDAVVDVEDHRFLYHNGIDPVAICRAIYVNLRSGELAEGGSTLTQQLAKNMYFMENRNLINKIAEAFMALKLEDEYTKDEILELYVNNIYFGDGYYCVYDASMGYFGKIPSQMSDYECTLLAGIPNAPSVYAPTQNPELAEERRQVVLRRMVQYGSLSQEEAEKLGLVSEE